MIRALSRGGVCCAWAVALLLGAGAAAGQEPDGKKNEPAAVGESYLKTHTVPAGLAPELTRLLQKLYPPSETVRISEAGPDEVVVYAPTTIPQALARLPHSARPGVPLQAEPLRTTEK